MVPSVGNPPSISRAGAGACMTPSSHDRQAYLGLRVTRTRNCAGTMSSRSLLSSPIRCNSPWQQGQILSSMSTTISIRGKCAGNAPRLPRRLRARAIRPPGGTLVLVGLVGGCDLFDIFQAQQHLLLGQRLRPAAKSVSLQLLDDLTQPLALVPLGKQHRLQRLDIVREVIARHQCSRSYSAAFYDDLDRPDSLRRSAANNYPGWVGVAVSRASWTRRQSSPSSSADNCAADKRITPSSILGQRKMPSSSRFANKHRPVPSQKISLIRSARLARNT